MYLKPPIEILKEANNIESIKERATFLARNMRPTIAAILACVFNKNIQFVDFSDVKYKVLKNSPGIVDTNLDKIARKLYIFETTTPVRLERKKALLIQMLEGMQEEESDFLFNWILKKKLPYPKISTTFITKSFPKILDAYIRRRDVAPATPSIPIGRTRQTR